MAPTSMSPARQAVDAEFEGVYRRHMNFVWRVLRRYGVPPESVEDAIQEVFLTVHRRWEDWDRSTPVRSWLFGIARRVASGHRRRARRHQRKLDELPARSTVELQTQLEDRQILVQLTEVLATMDPRFALPFVLSTIEGMSVPEIAAELGLNLNTAYSRVRKARRLVNRALATDAGAQP